MQGMQARSDTEDALEEVYMDALEQLQNKRQEEKGAYRNLQREMEEYYALWVHCLLYTSDVYKRQVMYFPFGASVTGCAWLSSARVVRCWVKSRNERNPCS